ncbi:MAG TPA: sigma-70 family RNA polymerase sigma factor, partial [Pirellulales bacterium]
AALRCKYATIFDFPQDFLSNFGYLGRLQDTPPHGPLMPESTDNSQPVAARASGDEFVRLFSRVEPRLHAYILTMVPNWADAADIFQEASSVLWRKFEQFEPGTNFFAWACQIARLEVAAFRKRNRRQELLFSDEFVAAVASTSEALTSTLETRQGFLIDCLQKLRPRDRELLRLRYHDESTIDKLAQHTGRNAQAVYKALQRIRRQLFQCIERHIAQGGQPWPRTQRS